jgi:lysophospholipase L1-like esterase
VTRGWALGLVIGVGALVVACSTSRSDRAARRLPSDCRAAVVYVALGDSTVEGVAATSARLNYVSRLHERLRAIYPAARVENLGVGGAVAADVLERQLARAVTAKPDLVTLSVGPNDLTSGVSVDDYARTMDRILGTLVRDTPALVVVNLLPDLAVTPRFARSDKRDTVGRRTVQFNEALAKKARAHGVSIVDLYERSRDEVPRRPELVASDGYHPSDLGYARWAELMWLQVQPAVARC